ncbi:MAG: hypothetical protein H6739_39240 [Alphaproteobacteria bacterium]|nr:hypothetical protein [Alphaproteobacteria bacterium]
MKRILVSLRRLLTPLSPAAVLALVACSSGPVSIQVDEPLRIVEGSPQVVKAAALDDEGQALKDAVVAVQGSSDEELLRVGKDGRVQCQRSGEATLTLAVGELTRAVQVQCVLVKEIRVRPKRIEQILVPDSAGAFKPVKVEPLTVEVVDNLDELNRTIFVQASPTDAKVVSMGEGYAVTLMEPGRSTIRLTAGDKTAEVEVVVGEQVLARSDLNLAPRKEHGFPLQPGRYRVSAGSDSPIALSVAGTDCETERGKDLEMECVLDKASTLTVENSPGLSFGKDAQVKLRVVRLPVEP